MLYEKAKRLRVKGATEKLSLLLSEVKAAKNPKKTITDKFGRSTSPSLVQHFDENIERITISAGVGFKQVLYVAQYQACNVNCNYIPTNNVAVPMIILPRDS